MSSLAPDLCIGVSLEYFQSVGKTPVSKDRLIIYKVDLSVRQLHPSVAHMVECHQDQQILCA